jgi:light-harvesting complex I chlorophyll a/b binding protein 1
LFDPAGLLKTATTVEDVRRYREAELMHGRVAMLAAVGFVVGEQLEDFPAFMNIDGNITGPAIFQFQQLQSGFWEPLLIGIGICEAYRVAVGWARPDSSGFNKLRPDYEMGNLM